jgi:kynureninase
MQLTAVLGDQREAFDVPPEIAYFNTANLSPQLHAVRTAGVAALERRSRPWAIDARDWFTDVERLRALFARIVGAEADGVALVPATSYARSGAAGASSCSTRSSPRGSTRGGPSRGGPAPSC